MPAIIFLYGMLLFNIIEASELRVIGANGVHACPGSTLTLECTVNGGARDTTVWEGTAFSECEISLLHLRFGESGGTVRTCNNGAITGRSVSFIRDTTYISQLVVKITTEMIRRSIECTHDNGTVHTIGHHLINIVPTWPLYIQFNTPSTVTSDLQLSFSWVPAVSDCSTVDIHYYILSANCGTCPFIDASTSITCVDVPSCGVCILAVQTAVNDYTVKDLLSSPVYVFLNQIEISSTKNCTSISSNNSEINIGPGSESDMNGINIIRIGFASFAASIASTAVLTAALTLCVIGIIMALRFTVKKKARSLKSLQRADAEKHQAAEIRPYEPTEPITHSKSDCVTLENAVYACRK